MPYSIQIDQTLRAILVKGTGTGTTADTIELIRSLRSTFSEHAGFSLLYDSTNLDIDSNPADMMKVAKTLFEEGNAVIGRMAVVVPERREELARIFSALAHPHGVDVNVFTHVSDARRWLGIERS